MKFDYPAKGKATWGYPDAIIGLCNYNLKNEPWQEQWPSLRSDPWIRPFSTNYLEPIFGKSKDLKGPYHSEVLEDNTPLFSFALWEAKKSDGDSPWSAWKQLDKPVRCLLKWQNDVMSTAQNDDEGFYPLVWAFTSAGAL